MSFALGFEALQRQGQFGVGVSSKSIQISLLQPHHAHSALLPDCASLNLLPTCYMWSSIVLTNWMPWTFCFGRSGSSLQMFREKIVLWHLQWVSTVALPPDAFWQEIKVCFDIIRSDMDARAVLLSGLGTVNSAVEQTDLWVVIRWISILCKQRWSSLKKPWVLDCLTIPWLRTPPSWYLWYIVKVRQLR